MSCYEWEKGTLLLPSAQVAPLKRHLRQIANDRHAAVRERAVDLHKSTGTRGARKYAQALDLVITPSGHISDKANVSDPVEALARSVLCDVLGDALVGRRGLHVPTVADVSLTAPKLTNRDSCYPVVDDRGCTVADLTFSDRTVAWEVPEGNHAVREAHQSLLGQAFFDYLEGVSWTRGTGGHGVGNNEYSRDTDDLGGGANYMTFSYGPREDASAKWGAVATAWW